MINIWLPQKGTQGFCNIYPILLSDISTVNVFYAAFDFSFIFLVDILEKCN